MRCIIDFLRPSEVPISETIINYSTGFGCKKGQRRCLLSFHYHRIVYLWSNRIGSGFDPIQVSLNQLFIWNKREAGDERVGGCSMDRLLQSKRSKWSSAHTINHSGLSMICKGLCSSWVQNLLIENMQCGCDVPTLDISLESRPLIHCIQLIHLPT